MAVFQTNRTILLKRINSSKKCLRDYASDAFDDYLLKEVSEQLTVSDFDSFLDRFQPCLRIGLSFDSLEARVLAEDEIATDGYEWEEVGIKNKTCLETILFQQTKERMLRPFRDIVDGFLGSNQVDDLNREFADLLEYMKVGGEEEYRAKAFEFFQKWNSGILLLSAMRKLTEKRRDVLDVAWLLNDENLLKGSQMKTLDVLHHNGANASPEIINELDGLLNGLGDRKVSSGWKWWLKIQKEDDGQLNEACDKLYENLISALQNRFSEFLGMLLDVYFYFQTYGKTMGSMAPRLLVLNYDAKELDAKACKQLDAFLNECNEKNDFQDMIWYAIVPVKFQEEERKPVRERFRGNVITEKEENTLTPEEYQSIIGIFTKYRIQVFTSEENVAVLGKGPKEFLREWAEHFSRFDGLTDKEWARYFWVCLPNIRILPQREAKYGENMYFHELRVEAAYVVAGLISACQDPDFLKTIYKEDDVANQPGIRMSNKTYLNQICEIFSESLPRILPIINGDDAEKIRSRIPGILIYGTVGGMKVVLGEVHGDEPDVRYSFDEVQAMTYVERIIRRETQDFERTALNKFFLPNGNHEYQRWAMEKEKVNGLFHYGESLEREIKDDELLLRFLFQDDKKEMAIRIKR